MNLERFEGNDEKTRIGGLLKLLPHWLYHNRFWHLDVIKWLKTPDGNQNLNKLLVAIETINLLGKLELAGTPISKGDYINRSLPLAKEMGYQAEGEGELKLRHRINR